MNLSDLRIMIVEDELIVADDIKNCLQSLGYSVVATVSSGEQSIKKAQELRPDLVLMDIILKKEMDGIEAAEIIIKNFNIPVIYLTAHSDEATINKAKKTEPYGYLLKPFNERDLLTNIEIALYKHKMETKLRMSEKWFSTTLKSIGDALIATDNVGNIKFMNSIAEKITGWTLEQSSGKSLNHVFNIINEKTLEKVENPVEKVLRDGSVVYLENHTALICKNGNKVPIEDSAAPIKLDNGDIQGVVMVFHDLTEKKKLQEQLMKRQKLESLGVLAGGIAHDFNNILTAVMGTISLSLSKLKDDPILYNNFLEAEKACIRASDLTNQLLTFSKGGTPTKKTILIAKVIKDCVVAALSSKKVKYNLHISDESLKVEADKSQLIQVINNIITNSIEAISTNGLIQIVLDTIDFKSEIVSSKKEKFIRITFEDNGIGISEENIKKIFDPYYTTKSSGSGLGLAIVNSIIEQHNGFIKVESQQGIGTKFNIYLPASEKDITSDNLIYPQLITGKGRILVMDDQEEVRKITQDLLSQIGYEVEISSEGRQTIDEYVKAVQTNNKFDIVILDLIIPEGLGGIDTLKELLKINPSVIALAMTGYSTDEIKSKYKEYGFKGFIAKPYDIRKFSELISNLIKAGDK